MTATLSQRIARTSSRLNRWRQTLTEKRIDEVVAVEDIGRTYEKVNRTGNVRVESHFARTMQLMDDDEERQSLLDTFQAWQHDERLERVAVTTSVDNATTLMKSQNPLFLDDGCGPDGRAA
jgi:hypothetical protein